MIATSTFKKEVKESVAGGHGEVASALEKRLNVLNVQTIQKTVKNCFLEETF
jgi:hypothetical protein